MAHLKRLVSPDSWQISKKEHKWITRPNPGPHKQDESITLTLVLKSMLNQADTTREVKKIINSGKVLVDNVPRKDHKFPLGLMDIVDLPDTKESYIMVLDTFGKFRLANFKQKDVKYCKILGKTTLKGKKTQLNLSSGRNVIVSKDEYKVGDTVLVDTSSNKIKEHLKFEKEAMVYITAGKYLGNVAKLLEIHKAKLSKDKITIKIGNHKFETLKDYAFVVDKTFAENEISKRDEKH